MEWTDVAQDNDNWLAFVNVELKLHLLQSEFKFTVQRRNYSCWRMKDQLELNNSMNRDFQRE